MLHYISGADLISPWRSLRVAVPTPDPARVLRFAESMDGPMVGQSYSSEASVPRYHPVAFSIGGSSVNSSAPSENFSLGQGQAPLLQKLPAVQEESHGRSTKFLGAVFLLMNAILGSGLLGQAYAASQSGVALYLVCLLVSAEFDCTQLACTCASHRPWRVVHSTQFSYY